jgi:hypothetical protein
VGDRVELMVSSWFSGRYQEDSRCISEEDSFEGGFMDKR